MYYCIYNTSFNRNLLRALTLYYEGRNDPFLRLELNAEQAWLLKMWRVQLLGPLCRHMDWKREANLGENIKTRVFLCRVTKNPDSLP